MLTYVEYQYILLMKYATEHHKISENQCDWSTYTVFSQIFELLIGLVSIISNFDVYASIYNWVLGSARQWNSQ